MLGNEAINIALLAELFIGEPLTERRKRGTSLVSPYCNSIELCRSGMFQHPELVSFQRDFRQVIQGD